MSDEFAHGGSLEAEPETRPACPARALYSSRGQRPRKTNPETDRPWRGRIDLGRGPIYGHDVSPSTPPGSSLVGPPVSGGVAPGYFINPLRGF
jgi:hypothetical protein